MAENNPDSRIVPKKRRRTFILLSIGVAAYLCFRLTDGNGQLQDTVTGEPIVNATIELSCSVMNFFHGSSIYRRTKVITDMDGYYQFSFFDFFGCFGSYVSASKKGFSGYCGWCLNYLHPIFRDVPKRMLLTKNEDLTNIRIQGFTPRETPDYLPIRTPNIRYHYWYDGFFKAKGIAKSDQETDLVRSAFCSTLSELYDQLSQGEKETLDQKSFTYFERAMPVNRKHNFKIEVAKFSAQTSLYPAQSNKCMQTEGFIYQAPH